MAGPRTDGGRALNKAAVMAAATIRISAVNANLPFVRRMPSPKTIFFKAGA